MNRDGCLIGLLAFFLLWTPLLNAREKTFTVVIDAGHGGKDPGAKGALVNEKVINLAVALKLGELISSNHGDVDVVYTRKTDRFIELIERANIANRNKADLFISIHTNSLKKGNTVKGAETYTLGLAKTEENLEVAMQENSVILLEDNYLQKYGGFDPNSSESYIIFEFMQNKHMEQSVSFASEIQKALASSKRVNRGVRQAGFLVLKATGMPSVLVELGFISNKEEERYLRSSEGQNQLAKSIYDAFTKYKNNYVQKQSGVPAVKESIVGSSEDKESSKVTSSPVNDGRKTATKPTSTASNTPKKPANQPASSENNTKPGANTTALSTSTDNVTGKIIYKVQILSSDKQLPANSSFFKGYKVSWYKDGNLYKYTYGESTDMKAIQKIQKEISKDFKGTFIIRVKDGKRLK